MQRRVEVKHLWMQAVRHAKRMPLAKRGKKEEKRKMKGEREEKVKLGRVEDSITGRMTNLFQVTPTIVWATFL